MGKLNPLEWCKFFFQLTGGDSHPTRSFILTLLLFLVFGVLIWRAGYVEYQKEKPSTPQPTQAEPHRVSGPATANGQGSVANTGDGNVINTNTTAEKPKSKESP